MPQQSPVRPGTLTRPTRHLLAVQQKGWQGKVVITLPIFIPPLWLCRVSRKQQAPLDAPQSEVPLIRIPPQSPTGHVFLTANRLITRDHVLKVWFLFWAGLTMTPNCYLSGNKYHSCLFFLSPPSSPVVFFPRHFPCHHPVWMDASNYALWIFNLTSLVRYSGISFFNISQ